LGKLSNKLGLKVSELQLELKADRKTALADLFPEKKAALANLNLEKKIYKKELKINVEGISSRVKAQIAIMKDKLNWPGSSLKRSWMLPRGRLLLCCRGHLKLQRGKALSFAVTSCW
jgi:hypothetical protein